MKLNFKYIRHLIFPGLLLFVVVVIAIQNYVPGTYLSGWDTLHPEFDFPEYFKRIFSVWQEHQGLGAAPAQAQAAEIPRLIIYYLSSLVLPTSFLRYGYFFLTLIVGVLGVYYFIKELIKHQKVAFLSALFYLLNLATLQTYVLPLEMFATHFATLGWIFLFSTKYILSGGKKNLLLFAIVALFTAPIAHTPTLFYVFFVVFALFIATLSIIKKKFKKGFLLLVLTLLINSFWILPNIYYVVNYGNTVVESKIHSQFSARAFQVGKNYGSIFDTAILKNFLFEWGEYNNTQDQFGYILKDWDTHLKQPGVVLIGLFFFALSMVGLVIAIFKRHIVGIALWPVLLLPFFFISNDNFLFQFIYDHLLSKNTIFKEALRFLFSKFSIMLAFAYVIYFSFTVSFVFSNISRLGRKISVFLTMLILVWLTSALIYFMWPLFSGNLINYKMKVKIPNEYFEMFNWFESQDPTERIAYLPMNTFWGWTYYNWGYEGAGFVWFGLRQPILNREFDRWIPTNEGFYWEASHALYSQNLPLFESVLAKYKVNWIILDQDVVDVSSAKSTYQEQFLSLIKGSSKITRSQKFNNILVFRVQNTDYVQKFVSLASNLPVISPVYKWGDVDQGFSAVGDYISLTQASEQYQTDIYYPFRELFSNQSSSPHPYWIEENDQEIILSSNVPKEVANYQLDLPYQISKPQPWFDQTKLEEAGFTIPKVSFDGSLLQIRIPKVKSLYSAEIDPSKQQITNNVNCDYLGFSQNLFVGEVSNEIVESQQLLRLRSRHASNCSARFILSQLPHHLGYFISVQARNLVGNSLLFWLENLNARRADLELYLPARPAGGPKSNKLQTYYFFQPPMEEFGTGYTLHFDNWSFNQDETVNELGKVSIYPIQWDFLTHIAFKKPNFQVISQVVPLQSVDHPAPYLYTVKINNNDNQNKTLSLFQSFDPGWQAWLYPREFPLQRLENHVKVNNWANGWEILPGQTGTVIIFYWPQLLEWGGFVLMIGTFIFLLFHKIPSSSAAGLQNETRTSSFFKRSKNLG
ncbi:MAG: hypothetical protein Q7R77_02245 [Candidatus Daviesbacteria bacterium]|nr:hypothetical protein [Candidatus Daviesbacteria bacterium]